MEVDELPRSAYSQTRHVAKRKKVSEALSKVPEFLCTHFHSRKSPALQRNLAGKYTVIQYFFIIILKLFNLMNKIFRIKVDQVNKTLLYYI